MDFARPAKDTELANVTLSGEDALEGSGVPDSEGSGGGRRVSILNNDYETTRIDIVCYLVSFYNLLICFLATTSS